MAIELEGKVIKEGNLLAGGMENELTPQEIVAELNKYIIGQKSSQKSSRHCFEEPFSPPEAAA